MKNVSNAKNVNMSFFALQFFLILFLCECDKRKDQTT